MKGEDLMTQLTMDERLKKAAAAIAALALMIGV
jgi:hypothetical protein